MPANEQMLIIYTDPATRAIKKYTTAYNKEQEEFYFMKCLERHGRKADVRIVPAKTASM